MRGADDDGILLIKSINTDGAFQNCIPETHKFINQCHPNKFNKNKHFEIDLGLIDKTSKNKA